MKQNRNTKKTNQKKVRKNVQPCTFVFAELISTLKFTGKHAKLENSTFHAYAETIEKTNKYLANKGNHNSDASKGSYCPKTKAGYCWKNLPKQEKLEVVSA